MGKYVNGNSKYVYSMDDCSCNVWAHYSAKRGGCLLEECCCAKEKQEALRHFPPVKTVPMKLVELDAGITADGKKRQLLTVPFHGYHGLSPHNTPSEQMFWVFKQAGVKIMVAEGSVGSVNPLLDPGDIVVPPDFCDFTKRPSMLHHFTDDIVRMKEPMCKALRDILAEQAKKVYGRVFSRGVYGVMEAPRYETVSEIQMLRQTSCDITGHTLVPEIVLARAIGACYASLYIVSNFGEGVLQSSWASDSLFNQYSNCFDKIGVITLNAIAKHDPAIYHCSCGGSMIAVPKHVQQRIDTV